MIRSDARAWVAGLLLLLGACSRELAHARAGELGEALERRYTGALPLEQRHPPAETIVDRVGRKLATTSGASLPWSFALLNDPGATAFTLPGGRVYVSRGLLVQLDREDELAAVLAHQIGHVRVGHDVRDERGPPPAYQGSSPEALLDLPSAERPIAVVFTERDERLADRWGARVLGISQALGMGCGHAPGPPRPPARRGRLDPTFAAVLDGLPYGRDPGLGFFVGRRYVHPGEGFQLDLPETWSAEVHGPSTMIAVSRDRQTSLVLRAAMPSSEAEALVERLRDDRTLAWGQRWETKMGGIPTRIAAFGFVSQGESQSGLLALADVGQNRAALLVALGPSAGWHEGAADASKTFGTVQPLSEPAWQTVAPLRVEIVELASDTTLADFNAAAPSTIALRELELVNGVDAHEPLVAGTLLRRISGPVSTFVIPP